MAWERFVRGEKASCFPGDGIITSRTVRYVYITDGCPSCGKTGGPDTAGHAASWLTQHHCFTEA